MTPLTADDRARIERVLGRAFRCSFDCTGLHHIPKIKWGEWGAEVNVFQGLHTFDSNVLTGLVIGAHDECVRVELVQGGPRRIKIMLSPRIREGSMWERHPTIEQAIEAYRIGVRRVPA